MVSLPTRLAADAGDVQANLHGHLHTIDRDRSLAVHLPAVAATLEFTRLGHQNITFQLNHQILGTVLELLLRHGALLSHVYISILLVFSLSHLHLELNLKPQSTLTDKTFLCKQKSWNLFLLVSLVWSSRRGYDAPSP